MKKYGFTLVELLIAVIIVGCLAAFAAPLFLGTGAFGPTRVHDCTVQRLYVDVGGATDTIASHYMVGTSDGVFECNNSFLLRIWNADELYAKLEQGKRYRITTIGNRVVGMIFQEYPYIIAVEKLETNESK